jgi:magnesium transporter
MIRSLYYLPDQPLRNDADPGEYPELLQNPRGVLWVDFSGEPPETCQPILERFGFHPLAIDDALQETHSPKVDDWDDYLYIVLNQMVVNGAEDWQADTEELDVFLGQNFIVTHHDRPLEFLDQVWNLCGRDIRLPQAGADHLLYRLTDQLIGLYMPIIERVDLDLDEIEDQVFDKPTPDTLARLFGLKRLLLTMRRITLPQREVLNRLARDNYRVIDPHDRVFFRDVYDHLVRLHDLNESLRDLIGGVLDTYLSVINNRMNEIMKTLTTITTLFMPVTFITGFFGMNFFGPVEDPAWTTRLHLQATLALLVLVPAGMYLWMRRRTWV